MSNKPHYQIINDFWKKLRLKKKDPKFLKSVIEIEYKDFKKIFSSKVLIKNIILKLFDGNFILIKKVYQDSQIENIIKRVIKFEKKNKSKFYKLEKKVPNFYRKITKRITKKYSVATDRTSYYFFRWNKSSHFYYQTFDPLWNLIKLLNGLKKNKYKNNTPADKDHVDRIQIVKYPNKTGYIKKHYHPTVENFILISVYLSKKGEDYYSGGTYFLNRKNKKIFVEDSVDKGDVGIFFGSLWHGVDKFIVDKNNSDVRRRGRWWVGLYSPESDLKDNRNTSSEK